MVSTYHRWHNLSCPYLVQLIWQTPTPSLLLYKYFERGFKIPRQVQLLVTLPVSNYFDSPFCLRNLKKVLGIEKRFKVILKQYMETKGGRTEVRSKERGKVYEYTTDVRGI